MTDHDTETRCGMGTPNVLAVLGAASLLMVLGGWGLICWARSL